MFYSFFLECFTEGHFYITFIISLLSVMAMAIGITVKKIPIKPKQDFLNFILLTVLTFLISVIFPIAEIVYNIFLGENTSIVYILLGYVIQLLIPIVIYWMFSFVLKVNETDISFFYNGDKRTFIKMIVIIVLFLYAVMALALAYKEKTEVGTYNFIKSGFLWLFFDIATCLGIDGTDIKWLPADLGKFTKKSRISLAICIAISFILIWCWGRTEEVQIFINGLVYGVLGAAILFFISLTPLFNKMVLFTGLKIYKCFYKNRGSLSLYYLGMKYSITNLNKTSCSVVFNADKYDYRGVEKTNANLKELLNDKKTLIEKKTNLAEDVLIKIKEERKKRIKLYQDIQINYQTKNKKKN